MSKKSFKKSDRIAHYFSAVLVVGFAVIYVVGCSTLPTGEPRVVNVTSRAAWWGQLHFGEILVLKEDALLNKSALTLSAYDSSKQVSESVTVDEFKANPGRYWPGLYVIAKGTQLRCVKLERWFGPQGNAYMLWVEILDGQFSGKTVNYSWLWGSPSKKGSLEFGPFAFVQPADEH